MRNLRPSELTRLASDVRRAAQQSIPLAFMRRIGYDLRAIGDGFYCTVYSINDSDYVLKIDNNVRDRAGLAWLRSAQLDAPRSSYLPRVLTIQEAPAGCLEFSYMAVLERLAPVQASDRASLGVAKAVQRAVQSGFSCELSKYDSDVMVHVYNTLINDAEFMHARHLITTMHDRGFVTDFHLGNVMYRGNELVMTDPVQRGNDE